MPETFDEWVAVVLVGQNPTDPAFRTAEECRDWLINTYPGIDNPVIYARIRDHENSSRERLH